MKRYSIGDKKLYWFSWVSFLPEVEEEEEAEQEEVDGGGKVQVDSHSGQHM